MKRPNILFVMTDDQGAWAMGCAGNPELRTPNLDRLAESGTRLDNFFCVSPVCSPARASIYTGKIPSQHGIHDWLAKGNVAESQLADEVRENLHDPDAPYEYIWPKDQLLGDDVIEYLKDHKTFTEHLTDAGYDCALFGKWHLGGSAIPQAGFKTWSTEAMGADNYYYPISLIDGKMTMQKGVYVTDYIANNAIDYIRGRDGQSPFFLAVHFTAPHSPWAAECHPKEYIDMYDNCPFDSIPNVPPHPWFAGTNQTRKEWDSKPHNGVRFIHARYAPIVEEWQGYRRDSLRGYFAAVTAMDAALGRILEELDKAGLRDNTLIVFTSDNGSNMGHHGIFGKGNGTYPQNMYDTSVKIPGIFSYPGIIPSGRVCSEIISHYDLYDTILDFANVPHPADSSRPGKSCIDVLTGKKEHFRDDVVVYDEYGAVRMIRTKEWKYVYRGEDGPAELYDLVNDPGELTNLVNEEQYLELIAQMKGKLISWFDKYVDPKFDGTKEMVYGKGQITSHSFVK